MFSARASAADIDAALENRAAGSLARQRRITSAKASGMAGLMREGDVGKAWMCCLIMEPT